jgi:hypothetical protein
MNGDVIFVGEMEILEHRYYKLVRPNPGKGCGTYQMIVSGITMGIFLSTGILAY